MLVTLWLTRKCNLRCVYCYEGEKKYYSMTKKTFDDSLQFITKFFLNSGDEFLGITFHGGEPMLEFEKIEQCVNYFASIESMKNKVSYILTTNGTIMTDKQIDFLVKHINLSISIDGKKEQHDKYRIFPDGTGSYNLAAVNAQKVLAKNEYVRARMTITKEKIPYIFEDFFQLHKSDLNI